MQATKRPETRSTYLFVTKIGFAIASAIIVFTRWQGIAVVAIAGALQSFFVPFKTLIFLLPAEVCVLSFLFWFVLSPALTKRRGWNTPG